MNYFYALKAYERQTLYKKKGADWNAISFMSHADMQILLFPRKRGCSIKDEITSVITCKWEDHVP